MSFAPSFMVPSAITKWNQILCETDYIYILSVRHILHGAMDNWPIAELILTQIRVHPSGAV